VPSAGIKTGFAARRASRAFPIGCYVQNLD